MHRDFDDAYSWIPSTFSGQGDACLYWANLTTKPAYDTVQSLLASAAGTTVATTSTAAATSTAGTATTTSTGATATQTQYGQCGGESYSGPTVCATGYTCKYYSDYYSQCL